MEWRFTGSFEMAGSGSCLPLPPFVRDIDGLKWIWAVVGNHVCGLDGIFLPPDSNRFGDAHDPANWYDLAATIRLWYSEFLFSFLFCLSLLPPIKWKIKKRKKEWRRIELSGLNLRIQVLPAKLIHTRPSVDCSIICDRVFRPYIYHAIRMYALASTDDLGPYLLIVLHDIHIIMNFSVLSQKHYLYLYRSLIPWSSWVSYRSF